MVERQLVFQDWIGHRLDSRSRSKILELKATDVWQQLRNLCVSAGLSVALATGMLPGRSWEKSNGKSSTKIWKLEIKWGEYMIPDFCKIFFGHNSGPSHAFRMKIGGNVPFNLPDLSKTSRTSKNFRKHKNLEIKTFFLLLAAR